MMGRVFNFSWRNLLTDADIAYHFVSVNVASLQASYIVDEVVLPVGVPR